MAKRGYPPAIIPAVIFSICSFVLLLMITISTPMWNSVFFLKLVSGPNEPRPLPSNTTVTWGVFGSSINGSINSTPQLGYSPADWSGTGVEDPTVNEASLHGITGALILHPIASLLGIVTFGFSLIGLCSRVGATFGTFTSGLMTLTVLVAFIVDMVLFSILKNQLVDPPYNDRQTFYGPAIWMTLAALVASIITLISTSYTTFSHHRYPRKWENEQEY
jgi:hypothetical protein